MKRRWLIALAALAFVFAAIFQAPAATLYAWFAPADSKVQIYGLAGTVADGRFASLSVSGKPILDETHWRLRPWSLLLLRAAFDFDSSGTLALQGVVRASAFGALSLREVRGAADLATLLSSFGYAFLPVDGGAGLYLAAVDFDAGLPSRITGTLSIQSLRWRIGREPLVLGDFEALLVTTDDGEQLATVSSPNGPLDASGEARLAPDKTYDVHLQMKAKANAPQQVANLLRTLGQPDNQGYYHIRQRGQLP